MPHPPAQELLPESLAYQHALRCWRDFQEGAKSTRLDKMLCNPDTFGSPEYCATLNLLPPAERRPVAFGELARYANDFSSKDFVCIRKRILPDVSAFELEALEVVKMGKIPMPDKLPVTIEEFPSRIWQRALASGSPRRLVAAGSQAIDTTLRLLSQIDYLPEADESNGDQVVWRIDIGDVPDVFDLIALAPQEHHRLKTKLLEGLMARVEADESPLFKEVFETIPAWVMLDDQDTDSRVEQIIEDTRKLIAKFKTSDRDRLKTHYRLRKLGRLLFRLGHRKESLRAARVLGLSAWSEGWQFQPIGGAEHASIRKRLFRPEDDADAWLREPALACSAMSLPLWLTDGVSRVPELMELFNQASSFPWMFPHLHHVYQWHLMIVGKNHALSEIDALSKWLPIDDVRHVFKLTP